MTIPLTSSDRPRFASVKIEQNNRTTKTSPSLTYVQKKHIGRGQVPLYIYNEARHGVPGLSVAYKSEFPVEIQAQPT